MADIAVPPTQPHKKLPEEFFQEQYEEGKRCIKWMVEQGAQSEFLRRYCRELMPESWAACGPDIFQGLRRETSVSLTQHLLTVDFSHDHGDCVWIEQGRAEECDGDDLAHGLMQYALRGCGLATGRRITAPPGTGALLEHAFTLAFNQHAEYSASEYFAKALARISRVLVPSLIIHLFANGVKFKPRWVTEGASLNALARSLPEEIINLQQYHRELGLSVAEMRNLISASNESIIAVRGCDPVRADLLTGDFAEPPPCLSNPPSPDSGEYQGQIVFTEEELERLENSLPDYMDIERAGGGARRFEYEDAGEEDDRRYIKSDISNLHDHRLQPVTWLDELRATRTGYRLLDNKGRPFRAEVDSVFWVRIDDQSTRHGHMRPGRATPAALYSDANEIGLAHNFIRQYTSDLDDPVRKSPFSTTHVRLGMGAAGKAVFAGRSSKRKYLDGRDPVLILAKSHAYIASWAEFAELCRCCFLVQRQFPWQNLLRGDV